MRATLSRANASTPARVSRSSAVVVMGLLNQPPPTVSRPPIRLCTRYFGTFGGRSARSRYARWRSLLDHRNDAVLDDRKPPGSSANRQGVVPGERAGFRWSSREGALAPDRIETHP